MPAKNTPLARCRGTRKDGSDIWEGRYSIRDPHHPGKRLFFQKGGFTRKTDAERWARGEVAAHDRNARVVRDRRIPSATFADAAKEWLRYVEHARGVKPSTLRDYGNTIKVHLNPGFGDKRLEEITTPVIERWQGGLTTRYGRPLSPRTRGKVITVMYGVMERARRLHNLPVNPVADVEHPRSLRKQEIEVFSPDEVWALVRAAHDELDGAIYLTAAFTGLRRGELLALRWRDIDFGASTIRVRGSYAANVETLPKSGKVRAVPMVGEVATALARLSSRPLHAEDEDRVFTLSGDYLDGSALRTYPGRVM